MKSKAKHSAPAGPAAWLYCAAISLPILICINTRTIAEEMKPSLNWECWIGQWEPVSINCIQHPSLLDLGMQEDPGDRAEAALRKFIHERIVSQNTAGLEEFVRAHSEALRRSVVHVIPIWNYPVESSWEEHLPARLVRAALCPGDTPCTVLLNRPKR